MGWTSAVSGEGKSEGLGLSFLVFLLDDLGFFLSYIDFSLNDHVVLFF